MIRHLEFRELEPFIPTRSPEAIAVDAILTMRMTEAEGKVGMHLPTPKTDAFVKRQARLTEVKAAVESQHVMAGRALMADLRDGGA